MASSYSTSWSPSAPAFHPKLVLSFPSSSSSSPSSSPSPPPTSCILYALLRLPPAIILDRYELQRLNSAGRLGALGTGGGGAGEEEVQGVQVRGESDLEAPVSRVLANKGGGEASLLLRLGGGGASEEKGKEVDDVEIPLHVRYQLPVETRYADEGGKGSTRRDRRTVEVEQPWVFWACEGGDNALEALSAFPSCPPPSLPLHLAFPSLASSSLHYLPHSSSFNPNATSPSSPCPPSLPLPLALSIPTGVAADLPFVETTTLLAVWVCAAYVAWRGWGMWRRIGAAERGKGEGKKEE